MSHLLIAITSVRPSIVTLEVSGTEPATHDLSRVFAEAGMDVVFRETWRPGFTTRERLHVANRGGRGFTKHQLDEMLVLATSALGSRERHHRHTGLRAAGPASGAMGWRRTAE
jgi:hypothetical protein